MEYRSNGVEINLSGHWNVSGVVLQIASLPTLDKVDSGLGKYFKINCSEIRSIDMSGLQLLYVWIQCASLCGMKAMLINLPEVMLKAIKRLGLERCFSIFIWM
jgi:ABC-type transporter Mla MlaB component